MASWQPIGTKTISVTVQAAPEFSVVVGVSPQTAKPGETVTVTIGVESNKGNIPLKATVTLFGQTKSAQGLTKENAMATMSVSFVAPSTPGTYTGSVKVEAYY